MFSSFNLFVNCQANVVLEYAISTGIYAATPPGRKPRSHPLDPRRGQVPPYAMTALSSGTRKVCHTGRSLGHVTHQV